MIYKFQENLSEPILISKHVFNTKMHVYTFVLKIKTINNQQSRMISHE